MFYKLSNIAPLDKIENEFNAKFDFPKLYNPSEIINGLSESILPIITMDKPDTISFGIWGILPEGLEENWIIYQNLTNTLNVCFEQLDSEDSLCATASDHRRCIILVTGFFTSEMHEGKMFPHHIHLKNHKPFGIAAIYNQLDDGFLTCSIIVRKKKDGVKSQIPNMLSNEPIFFNHNEGKYWLNKKFNFDDLRDFLSAHQSPEFNSEAVSKEFYDTNISYGNVFNSDDYNNFLETS